MIASADSAGSSPFRASRLGQSACKLREGRDGIITPTRGCVTCGPRWTRKADRGRQKLCISSWPSAGGNHFKVKTNKINDRSLVNQTSGSLKDKIYNLLVARCFRVIFSKNLFYVIRFFMN